MIVPLRHQCPGISIHGAGSLDVRRASGCNHAGLLMCYDVSIGPSPAAAQTDLRESIDFAGPMGSSCWIQRLCLTCSGCGAGSGEFRGVDTGHCGPRPDRPHCGSHHYHPVADRRRCLGARGRRHSLLHRRRFPDPHSSLPHLIFNILIAASLT